MSGKRAKTGEKRAKKARRRQIFRKCGQTPLKTPFVTPPFAAAQERSDQTSFADLFLTLNHWEIKGRFRKRVVLANVPSFRFSFRGNIRRNHPFGNHPFVNTKKGHWEIKRAVSKRVVLANVPSFRFSFRGNIRRNHPFGNHPFANPRLKLIVGMDELLLGDFFLEVSRYGALTFKRIAHSTRSACRFDSSAFALACKC